MPGQDVSSRTRPRLGDWKVARRDGECARCRTSYSAAEKDRIRSDGRGGFLAECCGEDES